MYQGSCLCGAVCYQLLREPRHVSHCHCRMCQKQHGAAFATYASLKRSEFNYTKGEDQLTSYQSSTDIVRKFCKHCGSNIEWSGSPNYPDWLSIALATFDTPYRPKKINDIYLASQVCWLNLNR